VVVLAMGRNKGKLKILCTLVARSVLQHSEVERDRLFANTEIQ
jgi:hypothetical protein